MQAITIAGRLGQDAKQATTQGGQSVCNFSVAVDQGFGDRKRTNWFRCAVWGKRGDKLAQYLTKGTAVTVSGQLEIGEYEGKPQHEIRVDEIALQGGGERRSGGGADSGHHAEPDDDDSDVPF